MTGSPDSAALAETEIFRRGERWAPLEYGFWVCVVVAGLALPGYSLLLSQALIMGIFAIALDLLIGFAGVTSLGHAAFFGVGGYAAGLLSLHGFREPLTDLMASACVAGAAGFACSLFIMSLRGIVVVIVTLIIGLVVYEFANQAQSLTGGETGLQGIDYAPILGLFEFDIYGRVALWYSAAVALLAYLLLRHVVTTPFGLSLKGLRENIERLPALGISPRRRLMAAFTLSAGVAGLAGALLVETTQFVSLEVVSFDRAAAGLIIVALGGAGTLIGPMAGAIVFIVGRDYISSIDPLYWYFWLGLLLFGSVFAGPAFKAIRAWAASRARARRVVS